MSPSTDVRAAVDTALCGVADPCLAAAGLGGSVRDLGLVQDVRVDDGGAVEIDLSFTEYSCAFTHHLVDAVERAASSVDGVTDVTVRPVWSWRPDHAQPQLRAALRENAARLPVMLELRRAARA